MGGISIKTGADKLVELVSEQKKISIDDAAKKLGVNKGIVQEWAEFLEEEGVVSLEFSLSKTLITERKITKEDIIKSASEVTTERDALARKIDVAISTLQKDTTGFEDIKKEFYNIQKNIKGEIDIVKKQLADLEKYEDLRKNLDKNLSKQKSEYSSFVKEAEDKLKAESQKYDDLRGMIDKERKNVDQYIAKIEELKKLKTDYERTINALKDSVKGIENTLSEYRKKFETSSKMMSNYKNSIEDLDREISQKKNSLLSRKLEELKISQDKIVKENAAVGSEIKQKMSSMKAYAGGSKGKDITSGFFSKNINTEKLIAEIENDKTSLIKEFEALKQKVDKFTIVSSHANIKGTMKELEAKMKDMDKKKSAIRAKIEKLFTMIKG